MLALLPLGIHKYEKHADLNLKLLTHFKEPLFHKYIIK